MKRERLLILSDVHGNLPALKAVLKKAKSLHTDRMIFLGDVVGYGADPCKCYTLLKKHDCKLLLGNHEAMLFDEAISKKCSNLGRISAAWTAKNISEHTKRELQDLPFSLHEGELSFYHAGPTDDGVWPYYNDVTQLAEDWGKSEEQVLFYGHTHRARFTVLEDGKPVIDRYVLKNTVYELLLRPGSKYLINVGSVGQQRDSKTDAGFVLLERYEGAKKLYLRFFRVSYNRYAAYRAMRQRGCGQAVASFFIREKWRRKLYGMLSHRL